MSVIQCWPNTGNFAENGFKSLTFELVSLLFFCRVFLIQIDLLLEWDHDTRFHSPFCTSPFLAPIQQCCTKYSPVGGSNASTRFIFVRRAFLGLLGRKLIVFFLSSLNKNMVSTSCKTKPFQDLSLKYHFEEVHVAVSRRTRANVSSESLGPKNVVLKFWKVTTGYCKEGLGC